MDNKFTGVNGRSISSLGAVSEVFEDNVGTFKQIREDIEEINRNAEMFA